MRPWTGVPRPLLYLLAVLFCAATTLYACVWMYDMRQPTLPAYPVELGFNLSQNTQFDLKSCSIYVYNVVPGSPAERADLRPGDAIIAINGTLLTSVDFYEQTWRYSHPGDPVDVTVRRPDAPQPITLHAVFRATRPNQAAEGLAKSSAEQIVGLFPLFFLLVGFAVLFFRIDDPMAWLLAALFTCFIATPSFHNLQLYSRPSQEFLMVFHSLFYGFVSGLFYLFFAVFPERSRVERWAPWLKWVALAFCFSQAIPGFAAGDPRWPAGVNQLLGLNNADRVRRLLALTLVVLGMISLIWNRLGKETPPESRRKSRVMLGGMIFGILPIILERIIEEFTDYRRGFWVDNLLALMLLLYPLSFGYAVVKYRVLEIPALLRRSARYVLVQRSFSTLLLLGALAAVFLFSRFFSGVFAAHSQAGMALSAFFGVALVWASAPFVKRGSQRIDRAFFRSSYDARVILQDLAEKTRSVTDRGELAALLDGHLMQALHPKSLVIYAAASDGTLHAVGRKVPAGLESLRADAAFLQMLAEHGRAWDVPPPDAPDALENFPLAPLAPECLVPLLGHAAQLVGLLVLGQPLSEEPYSHEDKRLLDSVAGQAAIALENIRMAEHIADRMEVERRAAHEIEIARDVQSRLFPQVMPPLATLDYTGSCMQARQVGGDYYDFLDLGSSHRLDRGATRPLAAADWHLAFVLADISGKGIAGALLMANLQANLRSRYAIALDDLPRLLKSVNQLFYENTPDDRYATLFFAVYDDHSREFEYANCGHNAPLLFRANGSLERLTSTSTVIGLFPEWECVTRRITLAPGDLLVIYTDGVTEANDAAGEEFGEARLIETVRACLSLPPRGLVAAIQNAVQIFSFGEQSDDLTMVIARAR
jgi:sigma-B regulation protein RsbU (phosphoserine phosphatase)